MTAEILLLRGINVGGHRKLPMAELTALLQGLGAEAVATYIQSGNAVYRGQLNPADVAEAIAASHGFRPHVLVRSLDDFRNALDAMPWADVADPKALHLFLTERQSKADLDSLKAAAGPDEQLALVNRGVWLHTPRYLSGSKIAGRMEQLLGVPTTARNWRTVTRLHDMAQRLA